MRIIFITRQVGLFNMINYKWHYSQIKRAKLCVEYPMHTWIMWAIKNGHKHLDMDHVKSSAIKDSDNMTSIFLTCNVTCTFEVTKNNHSQFVYGIIFSTFLKNDYPPLMCNLLTWNMTRMYIMEFMFSFIFCNTSYIILNREK